MDIVKVQLARAIWLFDTQELNPRGLKLYPDIFRAFVDKYQFAVVPKDQEIQAGGSIYFKQGRFFHEPLNVQIEVEFELHSDGLVANSRHSTEASDAFLQDGLSWIGEQLGASYPPSLHKKRIYRDELIVNMNPQLDKAVAKLVRLSEMLSTMTRRPTQVTSITFGSEGNSPTLSVDRRANTPFEEGRYYSTSGLQTSQHIEMLTIFEKLMAE